MNHGNTMYLYIFIYEKQILNYLYTVNGFPLKVSIVYNNGGPPVQLDLWLDTTEDIVTLQEEKSVSEVIAQACQLDHILRGVGLALEDFISHHVTSNNLLYISTHNQN